MSTLTRRPPVRGTRSEKLVMLRSAMPVQLMTLHHDIPAWNPVIEPAPQEDQDTTTPQVPGREAAETTARKGGAAR
jgi:hypothetical protein